MHSLSLVSPAAVAVRREAVAHGPHEPRPGEPRGHPRLAVPHLRHVARARRRAPHSARRRQARRVAHLGRLRLPRPGRGSREDHAPASVTPKGAFSLLSWIDLTFLFDKNPHTSVACCVYNNKVKKEQAQFVNARPAPPQKLWGLLCCCCNSCSSCMLRR